MNNKRRIEIGLALTGIMCWAVAFVRQVVLSVSPEWLILGVFLLGDLLIIIAVVMWRAPYFPFLFL
jgi:hypothetical protein